MVYFLSQVCIAHWIKSAEPWESLRILCSLILPFFFQPRYWWEDVDFSLKVLASGVHTCRFNHLVVAKKFIESGGATTFKEEPASSTECSGASNHNKDLLPGDNMVTAPDREDAPFLAAPAYYLLERYLELMGAAKLFPVTEAQPQHPVLVVDCYVNLGPKLTVEFVSSHDWEKGRVIDDVKRNTRCVLLSRRGQFRLSCFQDLTEWLVFILTRERILVRSLFERNLNSLD